MRAIALPAIRFYQRRISPYKGFSCAYRVHLGRCSCSELGWRAVRRFGLLKGVGVLRLRLERCGEAHRRHAPSMPRLQQGSAPCDLPCDCGTGPGCDLPDVDCRGAGRFLSCCDACSCDWPQRSRKPDPRRRDRPPPRRDRTHPP